MSERLNETGNERQKDLERLKDSGNERSVELEKSREREAKEADKATDVEKLTNEAESQAAEKRKEKIEKSPAEKRTSPKKSRKAREKASFKKNMDEAQRHMSPTSRTFSKVIHNKAVEKTSDAVGNTVARPNAILAGSFTAFVFTLGIYALAKHLGYPLSGFETIAAFILGWAVGLLFDYLRVMITGKKA